MALCRSSEFTAHHPEDIAIGRTNRAFLEARDMRFAPRELADRFAAERAGDPDASFGYHGVFLMPRVLGGEDFWNAYASLDERSSLRPDFGDLLQEPILTYPSTICRQFSSRDALPISIFCVYTLAPNLLSRLQRVKTFFCYNTPGRPLCSPATPRSSG